MIGLMKTKTRVRAAGISVTSEVAKEYHGSF
jgi:hypothetical protein